MMMAPAPLQSRFIRYVAVGGGATASHYLLLVMLVEWANWPAPAAALAGAMLGAQVAFFGNRRFTFDHQGPMLSAWWRFQATAVLGGLVSASCVAIGQRIGLHYLLAQAVGTVVALLLTYAINRHWSFGRRKAL